MALNIRAQVQLLADIVDGELEEEGQPCCTTSLTQVGTLTRLANRASRLSQSATVVGLPPSGTGARGFGAG